MKRPSADDLLLERVRAALVEDFLVDESQIDVVVERGVVNLVGAVGSYAEKVVARHAAQRVDGVRDLVDNVDVKPPDEMHPSDAELTTMVEQVLRWDALVPEHDIVVSVADGLVALTGSCPTAAQAAEAERAVSHLSGVRDVLNRISVAGPSPSPADVRDAITDALQRRAAHRATQLDIVVDGDSIVLRGDVQSAMERRAVLGAVSHLPGVREVGDELRIVVERPLG